MATSQHDPLEELYRRPGFMIRRVHQIAVSLFIDETGKLGVTNRQYGILFVLNGLASTRFLSPIYWASIARQPAWCSRSWKGMASWSGLWALTIGAGTACS